MKDCCETYEAFAPGFISFAKLCHYGCFFKNLLFNNLKNHDNNYNNDKKYFSDHHLSHNKVFFPSPFEEAVILTADGVGEWATTTIAIGKNNNLEQKELHFPHSLGLLYSFTYYAGFKVNSGEYN